MLDDRSLRASDLRRRVADLESDLAAAKANLARVEQVCSHQWGPVVDASIHHDGYTDPGDPPGTMGINWRGPCYVPGRVEQRWSRTCTVCGKVEFTTRTNKLVIESPEF